MFKYIILITFLMVFNLVYSIYSLRVWKEYTESFYFYSHLVKENMLLMKEVHERINYRKLLKYARKHGFKDVSPKDVKGILEIYLTSEKSEQSRQKK
ncbi:hypothetical protein [Aquifex aeolicus]|uniref:hypothetical protein n=1 Tax=Aquifex aeolicus TaxID=63363 RepID=UPI0013E8A782|nr:hypothetical protein [Aquifex aeolicus]